MSDGKSQIAHFRKKKEMKRTLNICSNSKTGNGTCDKERGGNQGKMKGRQR